MPAPSGEIDNALVARGFTPATAPKTSKPSFEQLHLVTGIPMINVSAHFSKRFDRDNRKARAGEAIALLKEAINDDEFRTRVLATEFADTRWLDAADKLSILSPAQIWSILSSGIETGSAPDNEWDLRVDLYRARSLDTIGHAEAGTIYTTYRYFGRAPIEDVAAHWAHEWCHTAGFYHDYRNTARRGMSVPYAIGDIVTKILAR